ncbi:uncharacterized protein LY89DRAFT_675304 [Mollisia scopiformis]|uniref:Uncharacterized protein n=1 Tax=Mollisia scopiformis TaxID=149040 RepID=A0A132BDM0_MOLSC|nr:uncharacterized protein LY89DRAFT_675304 [Mollisia scopiformis]KUJ10478.1 hypothetical protein LY89DRAFT_675304 [Mollisia scopiformis]
MTLGDILKADPGRRIFASLYLGLQQQSAIPFARCRDKYNLEQYKEKMPCTVPLYDRLVGEQANFDEIARIAKGIAETHSEFELRFGTPFIYPNLAAELRAGRGDRRVIYSLLSSGYDAVRKDLNRELGDVLVYRNSSFRQNKDYRQLPQIHRIRDDNRTKNVSARMNVARRLDKYKANICFGGSQKKQCEQGPWCSGCG